MATLTFKFDESYKDKRSLMVAGWIADDKQWKRVETRWRKAIAYENRSLSPEHRIKRYHAAEMNSGAGPFNGWDRRRKNRFTNNLLKIVSNGHMTAAGCGMDLRAFDEIFPHRSPKDYAIPYIVCMGTLLHSIADAARDYSPEFRIAIVHDHGDWDRYALSAYGRWIDDDSWGERHRFVGITPSTWREDVGLQAADLIAYEAMRAFDNELLNEDVPMRYALRQILDSKVPVYGVYHGRNGLEKLASFFEQEHSKSAPPGRP